jgi:soluble lytic murein transglycosylase-like protein
MRAAELDKAEAAVRSAEGRRLLTEAEQDHFLTRIAAGLFARDDEAGALRISREAAARSNAPRAYWVAGLAAFALEDFASAAGHFEDLARLPRAHAWEVSAAGFWAARSHLRAKRFDRVDPWLEVAAKHPRSFYGLLAIRSLGRGMPFNWEMPETTQEQISALQRHPAGQRGFMLLQAGQQARAEAEFARLAEAAPRDQRTALFAVALRANLSGLAARLGRDSGEDTRPFDSSAYPIPPWQPSEGFAVDPALVYAFIRQESRFDPRAVSPAGARGLMQLMPRTAAMLNGGPVRSARLHDPSFNMTLGQRYLQQLLESEPVGGDLIRLAASYNAGPGTVVRWKQRRDQRDEETREDALLAIETLPSPETRHFITRVLYSYWMYSERMGQPAPSLDAVAQGAWPSYVPPVSLTARAIGPNAKDR